jgi:hypothetical protein
MASNKTIRLGPFVLTTATNVNIFNPATTTGGVNGSGTAAAAPNDKTFVIWRHIRVTNKTATAQRFALWLGASTAQALGTEVIAAGTATSNLLDASTGVSVAANSFIDWYGLLFMSTSDFLVGGASASGALTIEGEGEVGIA